MNCESLEINDHSEECQRKKDSEVSHFMLWRQLDLFTKDYPEMPDLAATAESNHKRTSTKTTSSGVLRTLEKQ